MDYSHDSYTISKYKLVRGSGLPSREERMFNIDTQHIIAYEANVSLSADQLGGSCYVEWLTNEIEDGACKVLEGIDRRGGMWECLKSGWLRQLWMRLSMS